VQSACHQREHNYIPYIEKSDPAEFEIFGGFQAGRQIQPTDESHGGINKIIGPDNIPKVFEQSQGLPGTKKDRAGLWQGIGQPFSLAVTIHGFSCHSHSPRLFIISGRKIWQGQPDVGSVDYIWPW